MKNRFFKNVAIMTGTLMVIGLASYAVAGRGYHDNGNGYHKGGGGHHGMYDNQGAELTGPGAEKLRAERDAFIASTQDMRQEIIEKRANLRQELANETPDRNKAGAIQAEISELKSQIAQKRIDHQIAMRKINPDAGYGYHMMDGPRGKGMRGHGDRACW